MRPSHRKPSSGAKFAILVVALLAGTLAYATTPGTVAVAQEVEADPDTVYLEIGVLQGDATRVFGQIADVDVDSHGNIVVLDRQNYAVSWFSSEGRFLGAVGRDGDGPEEFRGPEGMAVGPSDHVYVLDAPLRRIQVFALSKHGPASVRFFPVPIFAGDICIRGHDSDATIVLLGQAPPVTRTSPLVHILSLDGNKLSSFGLPLQESTDPSLPEAMRRTLEQSNNRGDLSCAPNRVTITSERLGIVQSYSVLGDLAERIQLDDFVPVKWKIEGRRVQMAMDSEFSRANTIRAIATLSDDAVLITIHEASSTSGAASTGWRSRHSLIVANLKNGEHSPSYPEDLIVTKVVGDRLYGYANDPFPRVIVRSAPAWFLAHAYAHAHIERGSPRQGPT